MARLLLLADSNFENNYGKFQGRKIIDLETKSCQSRRVVMQELDKMENGIVVLSCLDMVAADVVRSNPVDADAVVEVHLNQLLYKLIDCVDQADGKLFVGVMAPLFWTSHSAPVKRVLNHFYKQIKSKPFENIWISEYLREINAGADGVHLTESSAFKYIQRIIDLYELISVKSGSNLVRLTEVSNGAAVTSWADDQPSGTDPGAVVALGPPEDMEVISPARTTSALSVSMLQPEFSAATEIGQVTDRSMSSTNQRLFRMAHQGGPSFDSSIPPPRISTSHVSLQPEWRTSDVNTSLLRIERRLGALEAKSFLDDVMMAGLQEQQDTEANRAMLNRVTMAGVEVPGLENQTREEDRLRLIKEVVAQIIDIVKQDDHQFKVLFVRHLNRRRGQPRAVLELKMESEQQAATLRADFVKRQKDKDPNLPAKLNFAPVVRMSTRVRIEILHSIANLIKRRDVSVIRAMCLQYIPKPVLKIVRKSQTGAEMVQTMTFIEAVCWAKENDLVRALDLSKAYERAGSAYNRVLSQCFVILTPIN